MTVLEENDFYNQHFVATAITEKGSQKDAQDRKTMAIWKSYNKDHTNLKEKISRMVDSKAADSQAFITGHSQIVQQMNWERKHYENSRGKQISLVKKRYRSLASRYRTKFQAPNPSTSQKSPSKADPHYPPNDDPKT
jgi:hypothetical protein